MTTLKKYRTYKKPKLNASVFLSCGISKADFLEEEAPRLEQWLEKNMHGEMGVYGKPF